MLIDQGWVDDNPDIVSFGKSIYNGYFLALLYSGRFDEVFELTKKWKDSLMYRGILAGLRQKIMRKKPQTYLW